MEPLDISKGILYNEDCISGAARHIPDGSIDLLVTDPPYGIEGDRLHRHYNRDERFVVSGYVEVPWEEYGPFCHRWIREAERVLRPGGSLYILSGYTNLYHILDALRSTSLHEVNHIIWKYNFGVFTQRKFISSHYHILFYEKPGGKRTFHPEARYGMGERGEHGRSLNNSDREDVWVINREYKPGRSKNKNELPLQLLIKILQYSSNEGDLVCDFFGGGCTVAKVAVGLNRRFVGFEISESILQAKREELLDLEPGALLPSLRQPLVSEVPHRGTRWSEKDRRRLLQLYRKYQGQGLTKKEILQKIGVDLGSGRWGVERALRRRGRL